jgi:hypothetical protein
MATTISSLVIDKTVNRAWGPVGMSATEVRRFHLATVFWLILALGQNPQALLAMLFARRIASVVVARPWPTWPIVPLSTQRKRLHHQNPGSNT